MLAVCIENMQHRCKSMKREEEAFSSKPDINKVKKWKFYYSFDWTHIFTHSISVNRDRSFILQLHHSVSIVIRTAPLTVTAKFEAITFFFRNSYFKQWALLECKYNGSVEVSK